MLLIYCRFGQKFVDRVANPKDLVLFHRRKLQQAGDQKSDNTGMELTLYCQFLLAQLADLCISTGQMLSVCVSVGC